MHKHPVETVGVGDLVSLTWKTGDLVHTSRGRIAEIQAFGRTRVLFTEQGYELGRFNLDSLKLTTCVIHERYTPEQPSLFDTGFRTQLAERLHHV